MRKKAIAAILLIAISSSSLIGCAKEESPSIVASVDSQTISSEEVYNILYKQEQELIESYGKNYEKKMSEQELSEWEKEKESALETLIRKKIILSKASEFSIDTSDENLEGLINKRINSLVFDLGSIEEFNNLLSTNGLTYEEFKLQTKDSIIEELVLDKICEHISVSNADVYNYYKDTKEQYKTKAAAYVKMISFSKLNSSTKNVISKINNDTFDSVFNELRLQDSQYISEYDLGIIPYSSEDYSKTLTEALSNMKKNEVSDLIEVDGSHVIVKVYNTYEEDSIIPIDDIYSKLKEDLLTLRRTEHSEDIYSQWREEANIKILINEPEQ